MLSLWARQELVSFWERVAQPVIVGMSHAIDPFQQRNSARHPNAAFANGQVYPGRAPRIRAGRRARGGAR